jgi:predicted DNA-binding protein (MmcQ/YjbR family)
MGAEWVRKQCLSFPHVTESIQWGDHLVFKIAGKIFAITTFEPEGHFLSVKCSDERFEELVERPGIVPAPYLARAKWVALENEDAMPPKELAGVLREAYDLVRAKLPRKVRAELEASEKPTRVKRAARR